MDNKYDTIEETDGGKIWVKNSKGEKILYEAVIDNFDDTLDILMN